MKQRGGWEWHKLLHLPMMLLANGPLSGNWNMPSESLFGQVEEISEKQSEAYRKPCKRPNYSERGYMSSDKNEPFFEWVNYNVTRPGSKYIR
jgi:hypothetical protein